MAAEKRKRPPRRRDTDRREFQTHLDRLIRERGDEWIVLADGNLVEIARE